MLSNSVRRTGSIFCLSYAMPRAPGSSPRTPVNTIRAFRTLDGWQNRPEVVRVKN